eukprot:scaffold12982_cov129-Cylindrotheca_fusiformis.AAC.6
MAHIPAPGLDWTQTRNLSLESGCIKRSFWSAKKDCHKTTKNARAIMSKAIFFPLLFGIQEGFECVVLSLALWPSDSIVASEVCMFSSSGRNGGWLSTEEGACATCLATIGSVEGGKTENWDASVCFTAAMCSPLSNLLVSSERKEAVGANYLFGGWRRICPLFCFPHQCKPA